MSDLEALMGLDNVIGQAGMGTPLTDENQADRKGLEIEGPEPDSLATIEQIGRASCRERV